MNKIYDKILLLVAALIFAGCLVIYFQKKGGDRSLIELPPVVPAENPYQREPIPESDPVDANWPEVKQQSSGWRYDVFTPPRIFIDADGRFSAEGWVPSPPPAPFGIYLAEISQNPYRLQLEGYIEEDPRDRTKTLLLFYEEEQRRQIRGRPGQTIPDAQFEVGEFEIERSIREDGSIDRVARVTINDLRRGEEIILIHGERRFDSGVTVVLRSNEDPEFEIELSNVPSDFESPSGKFTLKQINLEDSTVKVKKHSSEEIEPETKTLTSKTPPTSNIQVPLLPENTRNSELNDSFFDALNQIF